MRKPVNIPTATDDELAGLFRCLDGAWSHQTRELLARFRTERLDLNDNWASTSLNWFCPVCRRQKQDIARLSPEGVLLCHLDLHHDHLRDAGKAILKNRNPLPADDNVAGRRALLSAFEVFKSAFERFCDVRVCPDCNAADGEAKRALDEVPESFSFAPSEIANFILVRPNRPHVVDLAAAHVCWLTARADYLDRLAFAELIAERIAKGSHIRQGSPFASWTLANTNSEIGLALLRGATGQDLWDLSQQLGDRSVRRHGFASTSRPRSRAVSVRAPTADEWAALDARQARTSGWRTAPSDWRCPVCERDRHSIPRMAKSGEWTGGLHTVFVFDREQDVGSCLWRGRAPEELTFRSRARLWICQDCRQILTDVKSQDRALGGEQLSAHELRALVGTAQPHMRHEVDLGAAVARARANQERDAAAIEYSAHATSSMSAAVQYRLARPQLDNEAEAKLWLAERLGVSLETVEDAEWLEWLLSEGNRLSEEQRPDFCLPAARWA